MSSLDSELSDWCGGSESCEGPQASVEHVLLQKSQTREVATGASLSKATSQRTNSSEPVKAAEVSLDEDGYRTIAKLNSEREMLYFVKRAAEENGYVISDIGSLHGVVPYYSGKKATQSFLALQEELQRTSKQPTGWARKSTKKQKAATKYLKLSAKRGANKKMADKRKVEVPRRHSKKEKQHMSSSSKAAKHDQVLPMAHESKENHVRKSNRRYSGKADVEDSRDRDHTAKVRASKEREEHVKQRRHAKEVFEAQHDSLAKTMPERDLASTEATELDETMLVENSAHTKVEHTHEDAIKKKAVGTLHVVGQVKVEQRHLIKPTHTNLIQPTHATATPPAKNDPKHVIHFRKS
jgi:hypothetical protein